MVTIGTPTVVATGRCMLSTLRRRLGTSWARARGFMFEVMHGWCTHLWSLTIGAASQSVPDVTVAKAANEASMTVLTELTLLRISVQQQTEIMERLEAQLTRLSSALTARASSSTEAPLRTSASEAALRTPTTLRAPANSLQRQDAVGCDDYWDGPRWSADMLDATPTSAAPRQQAQTDDASQCGSPVDARCHQLESQLQKAYLQLASAASEVTSAELRPSDRSPV